MNSLFLSLVLFLKPSVFSIMSVVSKIKIYIKEKINKNKLYFNIFKIILIKTFSDAIHVEGRPEGNTGR